MKIFRRGYWCGWVMLACLAAPGLAQEQQQRTAPPPSLPRDVQEPPPLPPRAPDVRQPGETGWFIGVNTWLPRGTSYFNKGRGAAFEDPSRVTFQGQPKLGRGVELGLAVGLHNTLRVNIYDATAAGDLRSTNNLHIFEQDYESGTLLTTNYRMRSGALSFDYLTWPFPVEARRFRLKTLWQLRYTAVLANFDAPEKSLFDEFGQPIVDSGGNLISYAAAGEKWFISPAFGAGVAYYSGRHFRVEANAVGWAWPRRNALWDADASANLRYGRLEFRVGGRGFHFKTSTNADFFMRGTLGSAFVGVRWYSQ